MIAVQGLFRQVEERYPEKGERYPDALVRYPETVECSPEGGGMPSRRGAGRVDLSELALDLLRKGTGTLSRCRRLPPATGTLSRRSQLRPSRLLLAACAVLDPGARDNLQALKLGKGLRQGGDELVHRAAVVHPGLEQL